LLPLLQHHIRGDHKLDASEILHREIVAEANKANDHANDKAQEPLHKNVLKYLSLPSAPPILLEELVLKNSAYPKQKERDLRGGSRKRFYLWTKAPHPDEKKMRKNLLIIETLNWADIDADNSNLRC